MATRVTILGSGTGVPRPGRRPPGVLVRSDETTLLVDAGPGILTAAAEVGVSPGGIDALLLTHYHPDHCIDLASLLFALHHRSLVDGGPVLIAGAPGLIALRTALEGAWGRWMKPRHVEVVWREIGPGSFRVGSLTVGAVAIEHTAASLGYRIEDPDGAVIAISGDAMPCDGLVEVARDADLFVCEATVPAHAPTPRHLTAQQAGEAAAAAGAHRLCLTHFGPETVGHDMAAEARTVYAGELILASDGLEIEVTSGRHAEPQD